MRQIKPFDNFKNVLDGKESQTKSVYIKYFRYYLQFLKVKDPNSLITKRYYSPQEVAGIEDKIISYIDHLKKQKLNLSTIKGRVYSIFKFYTANRVNLDRKHISQYFPVAGRRKEDLPYTIEDVQKMLKATANPERDNFMLYLLSSTGMRIGALTDLTYGDIEPMYPEGYQGKHLYKVLVYRGTREEYYTFTTFECAEALDSYTDYRKRMGETITKNSPLLREQFNSNYKNKRMNEANFVRSFSDVVDRITNRAGVRTRGNDRQKRHSKMLDHAFRKFTISQMEKANMKYEAREYLTAHKTSRGLDNNYLRMSVEDRLTEYLKAIPYLTISQEHVYREKYMEADLTASQKLESLRKEKDRELQGMKKKYESEIESIREETNQKFNQIMTMIQQNPQLAQIKPDVLASKKAIDS